MFRVFRLKTVLLIFFAIVICVTLSIGLMSSNTDNVPKSTYTIVIDAGHGGRDDGCTGVSGTKESSINLAISRSLKTFLEALGIKVIMTRYDSNGLYDSNATNYKQSDMEHRIEIIEKAKADMVISIHQNSFADSTQKGAQAFYQEGDDRSRIFAESVQSQLISQLDDARNEANFGDYYLLKECKVSAVLIECGYLTNAEEEAKLNTTEYQNRVAYAIMCGVVKYFNITF